MDSTKSWYLSKGVWGSVATLAVGLAVGVGVLTTGQGELIKTHLPELAVAAANLVAGAFSLWGRVSATKEISK